MYGPLATMWISSLSVGDSTMATGCSPPTSIIGTVAHDEYLLILFTESPFDTSSLHNQWMMPLRLKPNLITLPAVVKSVQKNVSMRAILFGATSAPYIVKSVADGAMSILCVE